MTLRATSPVRAALAGARSPVVFGDLRAQILAEGGRGSAAEVTALLTTLVARRVLITSLHAPGTEPDALGHLVRALDSAGSGSCAGALREVHDLVRRHRHEPPAVRRVLRTRAAAAMETLAPVGRRRHPVTVDLRLDADITLPEVVAREAERAALLLARLSPRPAGTAVWADYHRRFYQRFGPGTHVPLLDVVADHGVGWPDGYPGAAQAAPRRALTHRDEALLTLAQSAALDGVREVVLDDALIDTLDQGDRTPVRLPPHLELRVRLDAPDLDTVRGGGFHLAVTSVSRAAAVACGRFLPLLDPPDRRGLTEALTDRGGALPAQLSFPPLDPTTSHVTRTVRDHWRTDTATGPRWPYVITREELDTTPRTVRRSGATRRPSWCYGTAGVARTLQLAALALGDNARRRDAEDALTGALTDPTQDALITDDSVCHGYAGLARVTAHAAADATPDTAPGLRRLAKRLLGRVGHQPATSDPGLLEGAAGIGLVALTAITDPTTRWDTCLLTT